jgi:hypothetical protein
MEVIVGHAAFLVAKHGIRGDDAVHLPTALSVQVQLNDPTELVFVSADGNLSAAATAERLATADPTVRHWSSGSPRASAPLREANLFGLNHGAICGNFSGCLKRA